MKYRIIEERDGNGHGHFELELWQMKWFKYRWVPVEACYGGEFYYKRKFYSKQECIAYILDQIKTRNIIEEGELV